MFGMVRRTGLLGGLGLAAAALTATTSGCVDKTSLDKATLIKACMAEGNTRASCSCMADEAHRSLDGVVFAAMAAGADGRTLEANAAYDAFTPAQKQSLAAFVERVVPACNMVRG